MITLTSDREIVKADAAIYNAACEQEANLEANTFPADHDASDAAWLASLNADHDADGPAPVECLDEPGDWQDGWRWELGLEPTDADWDSLYAERMADGWEADFEHCPGLIG